MTQHPKNISDEEFVAFQNGDSLIFRKVFDQYQAILCRFAFSFCKDEEIARDAVQESYVKLYQSRNDLDGPGAIYPFLFVIIKRHLFRVFRRSVVEAKYRKEFTDNWKEESSSTQEELTAKDLQSALESLLLHLPEKQRKVFQLNKLDGYSYLEIAKEMGISKNTVKNQVVSASKKLKLNLFRIYQFVFLFFFISQ
ncbi:RNA polymerase sigma factor [Sphingobacterium cellulitidis]|uniref:RNA polymerase sigma factor n=1 Tax=Sphingobacterium cellulitidis TaxID=1768011 RepID=UPI000B93E15F|nr:hypothetical protein CHT99_18135 [Sphingobacterium cellulitidis]